MNSLEDLLVESSRRLTDILVDKIGNNQQLFDEAMELAYRDKNPISMRAAWVTYLVAEKHPNLVRTHYKRLINILPTTKVDGVKRSALKMLADGMSELDEDTFGKLTDIAFTLAEDPNQPIAVKAFSIDILIAVSKKYPEIVPELVAILEGIMPDGSRGLKNKCGKLLKKYRKEF